jgi:hypothetical protein
MPVSDSPFEFLCEEFIYNGKSSFFGPHWAKELSSSTATTGSASTTDSPSTNDSTSVVVGSAEDLNVISHLPRLLAHAMAAFSLDCAGEDAKWQVTQRVQVCSTEIAEAMKAAQPKADTSLKERLNKLDAQFSTERYQ